MHFIWICKRKKKKIFSCCCDSRYCCLGYSEVKTWLSRKYNRADSTCGKCRSHESGMGFRWFGIKEIRAPPWITHIPGADGLIKFQSKSISICILEVLLIQLFSKWKSVVHRLMPKRAASKYAQWQEDTEPWGVLSSWQEARPRVTHRGTSLLSARGTAARWPVPWEVGNASALVSEGLPVLELPAFPPVSSTSTAGCCVRPFPDQHQSSGALATQLNRQGKLEKDNMCLRYQESKNIAMDSAFCLTHAWQRPKGAAIFSVC